MMIDLNQVGVPTTETNYVIFTTLVGLVCKYIATILNDVAQRMQSFSCLHTADMKFDQGSLSEFCQASFEWDVYFEKGIFNETLVKAAKTVNYDYIKSVLSQILKFTLILIMTISSNFRHMPFVSCNIYTLLILPGFLYLVLEAGYFRRVADILNNIVS